MKEGENPSIEAMIREGRCTRKPFALRMKYFMLLDRLSPASVRITKADNVIDDALLKRVLRRAR